MKSKRLLKLSVGIGLALVLALSLALGCAPAPAPAPAAPAMEPQKWAYLTLRSNLEVFGDAVTQEALDRIEERTNGLLDIESSVVGALPIKPADQLRAVSDGEVEMCYAHGDWHAADFPLFGLTSVPYITFNELEKLQVYQAIKPILERELNKMNVHILCHHAKAETGFWTTEPIDNIMDLGGRKMRAQAKIYAMMCEAMNAIPVPVDWSEVYTSLQRGLVKGVFTGYDSVSSAKLQEVAPYCHNIGLSSLLPFIMVNKEKWDALPCDVQKIVMEELHFAMMAIQAHAPQSIAEEVKHQLATGLKSYDAEPPEGWFEFMAEKVTKPLVAEEVEKCGPVGEEVLKVMEQTLGRKLL